MFTLEAGRLPVPSPLRSCLPKGFLLKSTTEVASFENFKHIRDKGLDRMIGRARESKRLRERNREGG